MTNKFAEICSHTEGSAVKQAMNKLASEKSDVLFSGTGTSNPNVLLARDQIVHLLEGWLNFSASVSCLLNNSNSQSIHLAYYAELRAALSLFAWSGISLRQNNYFFY